MGDKSEILLLSARREYPFDYIVDRPVNYADFDRALRNGGNSGNKLFVSAVEQYLTKQDICYSYLNTGLCVEEINERFDRVVLPTANIFGVHALRWLEFYADFVEKLKIPIFILGAGIQCGNYTEIDQLVKETQAHTIRLCEAVYCSGGEFGLRGYFTKEYLDRIFPNTAVVTGCPSMYQNGRNLKIDTDRLKTTTREKLRLGLNGYLRGEEEFLIEILRSHPRSTFMDQGEFGELLYSNDFCDRKKKPEIMDAYAVYELLLQDRIKLIYDVPVWLNYIRDRIDISLGSRIHGNLAAIIAGVPAMVIPCDARTEELADFFDIPMFSKRQLIQGMDGVIQNLNYDKFNKTFSSKFDNFEKFMTIHGISHDIEDRSEWNRRIEKETWKLPVVSMKNKSAIRRSLRHYYSVAKRLSTLLAGKEQVALFGAGYGCKLLLLEIERNHFEEKVGMIFDLDHNKTGKTLMGYEITYPTKEILKGQNMIFITTPKYEQEICMFLKGWGIDEQVIYRISEII